MGAARARGEPQVRHAPPRQRPGGDADAQQLHPGLRVRPGVGPVRPPGPHRRARPASRGGRRDLLHHGAQDPLVLADPAAHGQRESPQDGVGRGAGAAGAVVGGVRQERHGLVGLGHGTPFEEQVVGAAGGRVRGEHHDAGRRPVEPVQGHEVIEAELVAQPHQRGLLDEAAARGGGQEVRLVDDHEVLVAVQERVRHGQRGLVGDVPVVPEVLVDAQRRRRRQCGAVRRHDLAAGEARADAVRVHVTEPVEHVVLRGGPAGGGQAQARGVDAVARGEGRGDGHGSILPARRGCVRPAPLSPTGRAGRSRWSRPRPGRGPAG